MGRGGGKKKTKEPELEDDDAVPVEGFLEINDGSSEEGAASGSNSSEDDLFLDWPMSFPKFLSLI